MRKSTFFAFAAGMVLSAGAFSVNAAEIDYKLTPAAGVATDLQTITLEFTNVKNVAFYENNPMPVAVLENNTTGAVYNCQDAERNTFAQTDGIEYTLNFIGEDNDELLPITEPGTYTLTIRAFGLETDGEITEDLPAITAEYTIQYPVMYLLDPANGSTVKDLTSVTIDFTENRNVAFYENNRQPVAVLENLTNGQVYVCQEADRNTFAQTNGIAYTFNFVPEDETEAAIIDAVGDYKLTVRAMYLEGEDGENTDLPVITADYKIAFPVEYTLTPEAGLAKNLKTISLEFATKNVAFVENMRPAVATLENVTTGTTYYCNEADRDARAATDGVLYNLTFIEEDGDEALDIIEPGDYILTVRGLYIEGENGEVEEWLPVLNANYTIAYPIDYFFTNPLGNVATNLKNVTIEFPLTKNVNYYEQTRPAVATLENLNTGDVYLCKEPDRNTFAESEGTVFELTFIGEEEEEAYDITTPGDYLLTIRGLYLEGDDAEVIDDLPVITKAFVINYPYEYVLDPASGSTVRDLTTVSLEFPTVRSIAFFENSQRPAAVLRNEATETDYYCQEPTRNTFAETEGIVYEFTFVNEDGENVTINGAGNYTLTIAGMYDSEDEEMTALPPIFATYTMGFPVEYVLNPFSGESVENLQTVTITFPNNRNVAFYENSQIPVAVLENLLSGTVYNCQEAERNMFAQTEGAEFVLNFIAEDSEELLPIAEDGVYELTIRLMGLTEAQEDGPDEIVTDLPVITATYYIASSGVKAVEIIGAQDNDLYNVYTINGLQVIRNGNADSVSNLGAGLYIINGKKVLIRK